MAELEACRRQLGELDAARAALATEKAAHAASQDELRAAEETRRQLHNTIQVRAFVYVASRSGGRRGCVCMRRRHGWYGRWV